MKRKITPALRIWNWIFCLLALTLSFLFSIWHSIKDHKNRKQFQSKSEWYEKDSNQSCICVGVTLQFRKSAEDYQPIPIRAAHSFELEINFDWFDFQSNFTDWTCVCVCKELHLSILLLLSIVIRFRLKWETNTHEEKKESPQPRTNKACTMRKSL